MAAPLAGLEEVDLPVIEITCEVKDRLHADPSWEQRCSRPAQWIVMVRCAHGTSKRSLMCTPHLTHTRTGRAVASDCGQLDVISVEPL